MKPIRSCQIFVGLCAALVPTVVQAQASGLDAFPPMPRGQAPGASAAAVATAKALGRGVNFGDMLEAPFEGAWHVRVLPEYIDAAPAAGFQTVRLPVRWSNHAAATAPYTIDPAFMQRVESVVDGLLAKNIYVMLNMHHYRQLDGDQLDTAEIAVSDAMLRERYLVLWQQIADRFHSRGDHLLFELYNEPHGRQTPEAWNDLAARALAVVRKGNPSRIVVIGGTPWNAASGLETLELPNDSNLIVTVHSYDPFRFTHQGAYWVHPRLPLGVHCCDAAQIADLNKPLETAQAWSEAHHYPVYLGEFGANKLADMDSRAAYTRLVRDAAERRGMSWAYWDFAANFAVYDTPKHAFIEPLRKALLGQ